MTSVLWYVAIIPVVFAFVGDAMLLFVLPDIQEDLQLTMALLMNAVTLAIGGSLVMILFAVQNIPVNQVIWVLVPVFFAAAGVVFLASMKHLVDTVREAQHKHGAYEVFVSDAQH